jgi:hypothetical protein
VRPTSVQLLKRMETHEATMEHKAPSKAGKLGGKRKEKAAVVSPKIDLPPADYVPMVASEATSGRREARSPRTRSPRTRPPRNNASAGDEGTGYVDVIQHANMSSTPMYEMLTKSSLSSDGKLADYATVQQSVGSVVEADSVGSHTTTHDDMLRRPTGGAATTSTYVPLMSTATAQESGGKYVPLLSPAQSPPPLPAEPDGYVDMLVARASNVPDIPGLPPQQFHQE